MTHPVMKAIGGRGTGIALLLLAARLLSADESFPKPEWADAPNPLADSHAVVGGEISVFAGQYPRSLNYYLDPNTFSAEVFGAMFESLIEVDPVTAEYVPGIADRWIISDDQRGFTFHLDPRARWSDGRPITAADVKWTFDAIRNPTNLTGVHKVALETFGEAEILDERTIRFSAGEVHWRNLGAVGGLTILPRHILAGQDFNKVNFEFPVVSGFYRLGEIKEGIFAKLVRRDDAWHREDQRYRNTGNFSTITYRFFDEQENAFEAFRKGLIDVFPVFTARLWVNETRGDRFTRNWIVKQKIQNYQPIGFQGFAMNRRRFPFQDVLTRRAMAHLLDRERMNRTLMYSQYFLHRSYFEDLYHRENPCHNTMIDFDKEQARGLLKQAGWTANAATGMLEKDGRPFVFTFLTRDPSSEKFLSLYSEDLEDVGIRLNIGRKDWSAWSKDMEEYNFDMTWAAWSAGLYKDPESMWASAEAVRRGGNNITGFEDARVDALIEQQKTIFDVATRHAICREIDRILVDDCSYVLLWNINGVRLLYWNKFGMPPTVLSKYGDHASVLSLWWYDEDAAADLRDAMDHGLPLPSRPSVVVFDETFKSQEY